MNDEETARALRCLAMSRDNKCDNPRVMMLGKELVLNSAADLIERLQGHLADIEAQLVKCHMRELTAISEVHGVGTCYGCKYAVDQEPCYCADCDLPEGSCENCMWSGDPCGFCTRGDAMPSDNDNWEWHGTQQVGEVKHECVKTVPEV